MDNMNVYDKCQAMTNAIKNSREYVEFKEIKEIVMAEPGLKDKIDEFEKIRYEEQLLAIQGEEQNIAKMQKLEELYNILVNDPKVKDYFDKEVRFNLMIADVNKMIGESIKDVLEERVMKSNKGSAIIYLILSVVILVAIAVFCLFVRVPTDEDVEEIEENIVYNIPENKTELENKIEVQNEIDTEENVIVPQ